TAPGGYGWIFPKGHGYAEVGLGIIAPFTKLNAHAHLDQFLKNSFLSHRFKNAKLLEVQGGGVPLASPLKKQFAQNMILVGDAARHVNPITGGGIHTALSGGSVAAEFLIKHLPSGNKHSEEILTEYQDLWYESFGKQMWKLYELKKTIFKERDINIQNRMLFETMSTYFRPNSAFKKI